MQNEISFGFLWKCLKKCWILMLVLSIVVGIAAGVFVSFIPKKYSSSVDFYVVNTNPAYDYTTTSLLSASTYLISDYVEIIRSETVLNSVAEDVNAGRAEKDKVSAKQLKAMISSSSDEASVFTIKVTHTDRQLAYDVAKSIEKLAAPLVTEIAKPSRIMNNSLYEEMLKVINKRVPTGQELTMEELKAQVKINDTLDCFTTLNNPSLAPESAPDSPDIKKYVALSVIATMVIVYAIFVIKGILALKITTEDDVKRLVKRPLIGIIPQWEQSSKK